MSNTTFLARITEPSNDDYDNEVSDNCDHNFGTFDDFCVKNYQKVSHNKGLGTIGPTDLNKFLLQIFGVGVGHNFWKEAG